MIIKGKSRGRSRRLAAHLLRRDQNEDIRLYETRGTVATDVEGALVEMEAHGAASRCVRALYHASISPEAHTPLTEGQIRIAVDTLEAALGLDRQPRVVIIHKKDNREHVHVVWSRIDLERNRAIPDSWNYRHHEQAARALEALFGHRPVPGSRQGKPRGKSAAPRLRDHELWQQQRSGIAAPAITREITTLWKSSGNGHDFVCRLREAGYQLARGDRRVFVIIDRHGEVHSLARRIQGVTTDEVRAKLNSVDLQSLSSVSEMRAALPTARREAPLGQSFANASREVTQRSVAPRRTRQPENGSQASITNLTFRANSGSGSFRVEGARRIQSRAPGTGGRPWYRAMRAILIADFAVKIASARQHTPAEELAAAIVALLAERDAALNALGQHQQGAGTTGRRSARARIRKPEQPIIIRRLRFRRSRTKKPIGSPGGL